MTTHSGPIIAAAAALILTPVLLLAATAGAVLGGGDSPPAGPAPADAASRQALADIPPAWLTLYQRAATAECDALPWTILAAVGKVESDHGRSTLPGARSGENASHARVIYGSLPVAGT